MYCSAWGGVSGVFLLGVVSHTDETGPRCRTFPRLVNKAGRDATSLATISNACAAAKAVLPAARPYRWHAVGILRHARPGACVHAPPSAQWVGVELEGVALDRPLPPLEHQSDHLRNRDCQHLE